jgi:hypothetical protein
LPGEEARYAQVLAVVEAAKTDPKVKAAFTAGTKESDELVVKPLFQFRNCGQQLPHYWSTISKNPPSARTAIRAPPSPSPTSWSTRPTRPNTIIRTSTHPARLNSANRYTVTFPKDGTPPVYGFWSLSIYNEHHFFVANVINRFSVGTKNKDLKYNTDGSLTIYVQAEEPNDAVQRANWMPAPQGDFSLYVRAYWPKAAVTDDT